MKSTKSTLLAMAAMMGMGVGLIPANGQQGMRDTTNARQGDSKNGAKQTLRVAVDADRSQYGVSGPGPAWRVGRRTFPGGGWSVRQGQRMALKARNQKRHKAAVRGRA